MSNIPVEMDIRVNPYAAALQGPGRSKRSWDADYINRFAAMNTGDPVSFELTGGVLAEGTVAIITREGGKVTYVSGRLAAPEKGDFFILAPPAGSRAGRAVAVVQFPASGKAYRVEPTGPDGAPELWERRLDEVVCGKMPAMAEEESGDPQEIAPLRPDQMPDQVPFSNKNIISLQSLPGALGVIYLNFGGGYTSSWGASTYAPANVTNDQIKDVWKRVAEDFMPFTINVTTDRKVYEAAPPGSRMTCALTPSFEGAGVAFIGSWHWGGDIVCWSGYTGGKGGAEVVSHEVGHTLGLGHDGQIPGGGYYGGHGSGQTGWCTIMGASYYQPVTSWSKGEYQSADNLQDDLAVMDSYSNVDYRADDTGATLATSRYLEVYPDNTVFAEGVIERTADTDSFQFTTTGGAVTLTASPVAPGDWGNLAVNASLANASGTVIASDSPTDLVTASISTTLSAGTYTFSVTGAGRKNPLNTGFTSYGSLGYYSISGSVAGARQPTRLSVASLAPNGTTVGTVPPVGSGTLTYTIVGGNLGGAFSISNSGVLTVANNSEINYSTLVLGPRYFAGVELFVNITNSSNPSLTELNRRVVVEVLPIPPTMANVSVNVIEHLPVGMEVAKLIVSNQRPFTAQTFEITAGNADGKFAIDGDGKILIAGDLNASGTADYTLSVLMSDNGEPLPLTATAQVSIHVVANSGFTWSGGGGNNSWSSAGNWNNPLLPGGASITFGTAARQANVNDVALSLNSVAFTTGGFSISGNPVQLQSGLTSAGNNTWGLTTTLNAPQAWSSSSGTLTVSGDVSGLAHPFTAGGAGNIVMNGIVSAASFTKTGGGSLILAHGQNNITGNVTVSGGTLQLNGGRTIGDIGSWRSVVVSSGATLTFNTSDYLGNSAAVPVMPIILDGGTLTNTGNHCNVLGPLTLRNGAVLAGNSGNSSNLQVFSLHGTVTVAGTSASMIAGGSGSNGGIHLAAPTLFDVADVTGNANDDLAISAVLLNRNADWTPSTASLMKNGAGTMKLTAANGYTGLTTVNGGTLLVQGSLAAGSGVAVAGGTLGGTGIVNGPVAVQHAGMIAPGANGIGNLRINNSLNLAGTIRMETNKSGVTLTGDLVDGVTTITYGGHLVVSHTGAALTGGNSFTLFGASSYAGSFTSLSLPVLGSGLAWNTSNLSVNGTIAVISVGSGSPPPVPSGLAATAAGTTRIDLTWSASAGAVNYLINRDGANIAMVSGTSFADTGLAVNSSHTYTVVAIGSGGSSAPSGSVGATTAASGGVLTWDANTSTSGAQDGTGTWGGSGSNWWNGSASVPWSDGSTAAFGVNTATDQTVDVTSFVQPGGIVFNATAGGKYTLGGTGTILTAASPVITTTGNATISALVAGAGTVTKTGAGSLTLSNGRSSFTGDLNVTQGTLVIGAVKQDRYYSPIGNLHASRNITVNSGGILSFGVNDVFGSASAVPVLPITLDGGTMTNTGNRFNVVGPVVLKNGAVITGAGGYNNDVRVFAFHGAISVTGTSPSTIAPGSGSNSGYHLGGPTIFDVADVTADASADLIVSGSFYNRPPDWGALSKGALEKTGPGTMALNGSNFHTGASTVKAGTLQVNGSTSADGPVVAAASGTLAGTGTIHGPTQIQSGGILAPGQGNGMIGTLTIDNTLSLASGSITRMEVSLTAGVFNSDLITGLAGVNYDGTLVIENTGASPLPVGAVFCLFNAETPGTGNFGAVTILPSGTGSFNPDNGQLTIGPPPATNLLAYESFPYPAGGSLASLNGGAGWNGGWQTVGGAAGVVDSAGGLVAGASASPTGYDAASTGNSVQMTTGSRSGRLLDTSVAGPFGARGYRNASGDIGADGKTLYISFLQKPNGTTSFYEFELHRDSLDDPGRIAGIGNDQGGTNVNLRAPSGTHTAIGAGNTGVNLYVMRIDFKAGNDDVYIYRNPTSATEPGMPTLTRLAAADMSFDGISLAAFSGTRTVVHDEIRIGESWGSVTAKVPPIFTLQPPASNTVIAGDTLVLTASAGGQPLPTYQWYKNGVAISGKAAASLVIANVQQADAADYHVVATNTHGTATSVTASVIVEPKPAVLLAYESFSYDPAAGNLPGKSGGVGWGGAWTNVTGAPGNTVIAGSLAAGANAPSGYDARSAGNATNTPNGRRDGRLLDTSPGGPFGTAGYVNGSGNIGADGKTLYLSFLQQADGAIKFFEFEFHRDDLGDPGRVAGIGNDLGASTVNLRTAGTQTSLGTANTSVNFYVVRIDFKAGNDDVRVYRNPTSSTEPVSPTLTLLAASDMSFDGISLAAFLNGRTVKHDEIRFGESWAAVSGPATVAPVFTIQPVASTTALAGDTVVLSAQAVGQPSPTLQWYKGTTPLPGKTTASLTLANIQPGDAGSYSVKATNPQGEATSNTANIAVQPRPVVLLAYEGFGYDTGTGTLAGKTGGSGWGTAWTNVNGGTGNIIAGSLAAGSGAPGNYDVRSTGNAVFTPNQRRDGRMLDTSPGGSFGAAGYIDGSGNIGANGKTLYVSFLQQPDGATSFYEFEFHRVDLGDPGRIGGIGNDQGGSNVNLRTGGTHTAIGSGNTGVNLYVVRIDFKAGNDDVRVYRNPTSFTEPAAPTLTRLATSDMSFNGISLAAFTNSRTVKHDEIRFASSWADVLGGGSFEAWASGNGLGGDPSGFYADADGDGIANGLEWILGGNPQVAEGSDLVTYAASSVDGLTLTFNRDEDSIGNASLALEWSTDLDEDWNVVPIQASGTTAQDGVQVSIDESASPDVVTVHIPAAKATQGKVFARLRATNP